MTRPIRPALRDLAAATSAALLVVAAVVVGRRIQSAHRTLFVHWPPLYAEWAPHLGPGTPGALLVAVAVVAYGPPLASRLRWRALLPAAWAASLAWTWSLALVDGWHRGVAVRLTTRNEYLQVIGRFHDIPAALRDFTQHILAGSEGQWPAHIAGHPPAATLTFVLLDRAGLRGGGWAGAWCIVTGTTACVAVLVAVRALAGQEAARRAAPFLVLAPAAVWVGASADGWFTAVAAWSVALFATAVTGRGGRGVRAAAGLGSGLLFGLTCYLSYGLTLFALVLAGVLLTARLRDGAVPRGSALPMCLFPLGAAVVPLVFTLAGFDWWEAYRLLVTRYYQGVGGTRPYGYWVWANLACTVLVAGPATAAGLVRAGGAALGPRGGALARVRGGGPPEAGARLGVLVLSALLALLVADLSGMSKAETERIWLPFVLWLLPACALLTRPRAWLAAQAVLALLLNHLLLTGW
ncbi:hypothetical protein [Streptomyces sp. NPDC003374]